MNPADNIERSIQDLRFTTSPAADERILADAAAALEQSTRTTPGPMKPSLWRTIMRSNWTKLATAAAVIIVVGVLSAITFHQSAKPAYAIEQTIEANRGLRYVHIRMESPTFGSSGEAWVRLNEQGEMQQFRMDCPDTEDGPKVVVWQANKAEVWFKRKKSLLTTYSSKLVASFPNMVKAFDPKAVTEALYKAQADGRMTIETKMPTAKGEPITLVATSVPPGERREVYSVDPATLLVTRVERYRKDGAEYKLQSRWHYLEYNQEPDANVFVLDVPADVMRVDETTQVIGLPKGDLTDEQITVQVVREFFEALIARDYAKAGQLFSGIPAAKMEEMFGKMKVLRIVSIGEPKPHWIPGVGGMVVPCSVEIEVDGQKTVWERKPAVRPVGESQPDRWAIHGGI